MHTGGSLVYNTKTSTMIINTITTGKRAKNDIKKLWDMFCADESPEIPLREKVRNNPSNYHQLKKACGRYRDQLFKSAYKKSGYVDWLLTEGPQLIRDENTWLFYEYCKALREEEEAAEGEDGEEGAEQEEVEEEEDAEENKEEEEDVRGTKRKASESDKD